MQRRLQHGPPRSLVAGNTAPRPPADRAPLMPMLHAREKSAEAYTSSPLMQHAQLASLQVDMPFSSFAPNVAGMPAAHAMSECRGS